MKKILSILILQLFLMGLVLGQSATDIRQLKKQYESALQNQSKLILPSDVMEDDEIDGDLPTKQDLELMQTELEEKEKDEAMQLKHFGYDFFTMRDTLSIWNNLPVPPNYILGPGDEIIY